MRRLLPLVLVLGIFCCLGSAQAAPPEPALRAAYSWLEYVDSDAISQSWEQASPMFKRAVTKEAWQVACANVRGPLGMVLSRQLVAADPTTSLPGVPDGEYVVIRFRTVFANKKEATETVTPQKDADGAWRVSGYYIQ